MRLPRSLLAFVLLSACVSRPMPPSMAPPRPPVAIPPAPPPAPPPANWEDRPFTPGTWAYRPDARGSVALFGVPGSDAALLVRCEIATQRIFLSVPGAVAGTMVLRATTGARSFPARPTGGDRPYVAAEFAARDPQLDAIAFSRGRFLVSVAGGSEVTAPSWPELTRVIEDCRA